MTDIRSYQDLEVWQMAMDLVEDCYRLTRQFPREEQYGLTSQIRRAAVSIPANIAEGYGRDMTGSFIQFLRVAQGSVRELETHLLLSGRLEFISREDLAKPLGLAERISKMLRSLIRKLEDSARH